MSVPLIFKTLTLKNFLSFGNFESVVELDGQGTVTITGENIDQGGSNGAGKCFCINTILKMRNSKTGKVFEMTVGELYERTKHLQKSS